MGFESGSVSFRMFHLPQALPQDAIQRFAENAAPALSTLSDGELNGWVGWRHLLDRAIDENNATFGGYLRLSMMKAVRKIPEPLLRAECRMEELAHLQATGYEKVSPKIRREIRQSVMERLLPGMPPALTGISLAGDPTGKLLYVSALSEKQLDAFLIMFTQTIGFAPVPLQPDSAALLRRQANIRDWAPASFSPEIDNVDASLDPGHDFLTWLWFLSEEGGIRTVGDFGNVAIMIDGPLYFINEGGGAFEAVLRNGEPRLSAESKTAMLGGKKLKRAKLTLARGDDLVWNATVDASTFVFRGLKLPEGEKLDAVSKFQERMDYLGQFRELFLGLYDDFCDLRKDPQAWQDTIASIRDWVSTRKVRQ